MKSTTETLSALPIDSSIGQSRRSRFFIEVGDQSLALISQVVLNGSFFLIMLTASMKFEPSEFLKLTFATSLIPLIAAGLDFGLSQSCLALSFEHKKQDYVAINLIVKAITVAITLAALGVGFLFFGLVPELVLGVAAASMSFWTATRVIEQYARRFRRYSVLNIALAVTRISLGLAAIAYSSWISVVIAVYILAQVPIQIATLARSSHLRLNAVDLKEFRPIVRMAPITFLAVNLYSALPLITLWILKSKDDTLSAAAFGVVLMFLGPVDLLYATLKVYIFPKIIEADIKSIDLFGLGRRSMYMLMGGLASLLCLSVIPASMVVDHMYNARFPEADRFFLTYFTCHATVCVMGLYTLHSQRPGLVRLSLIANAIRAAATGTLFLIPGMTSYEIVLWSGIIIVLGELILTALLLKTAYRKQ